MVESRGCAGGVLMPLIMLVAVFFVGVSAPMAPLPVVATPQGAVATASLEVTLGADVSASPEQIGTALAVVQARLDRLVQTQTISTGSASLDATGRKIVVLLGDTDDPQAIIETLITTGRLELVDLSRAGASLVKQGDTILTSGRVEAEGIDPAGQPVYPTIVDNAGIETASAEPDLNAESSWRISVFFRPEAAEKLGAFTARHIGSPLAIVLDGVVLSVPTIQARIAAQAVIAGQFDKAQAHKLAAQISLEPLPVRLTLESVNVR